MIPPKNLRFLCSLALLAASAVTLSTPRGRAAAADQRLEVFSWWTSGGEAAALNVYFDAYRQLSPGGQVINAAIAGGAGSSARAVLQTRLAGGDPPDTWQTHSGHELLDQYVASGYVESLGDLYRQEGWTQVIPPDLLALVSKGGQPYAVPVGVHRGNVLWYNKKVLAKAGVTVGERMTVDEFIAAADKLKAAGITPLAVGDSSIWASAHLFENTLLGALGAPGWTDLFNGKLGWDDARVKGAMRTYAKMLDYQNRDHSALTWDQATKNVMDGRAAFTSMGDWAYGEFAKAKLKDNEDFGWVAHPGSEGVYSVIADGFTLAKGAPHRAQALLWLKAVGSKPVQEAFGPLKGCIPVRTDADRRKFGPYHQWSLAAFGREKIVPSCVHGSAATAAFQQTLNDAVTAFVVDRNVDAFSRAMVQAAKEDR